jgi:Flp pilus assembly protein TadG
MLKISWAAVTIAHRALPLVQQETRFAFVSGAAARRKSMGKRLNRAVSLKDRFRRLRTRMRADARKGSAAIEFAFVAPVFFVLLLGTFEAGIMFFAQSALQNGVITTGRLVRTGQTSCFTTANGTCVAMTEDQFKAQICTSAGLLLKNCATDMILDMRAYNGGFGAVPTDDPLSDNPDSTQRVLNVTDQFNLGNACDVVIVRAYYQWSVATPLLTWFLVNMSGGAHLLAAATAFRNEPFSAGAAGC